MTMNDIKYRCRAQRHQTASESKTYEAAMACALSKEARKNKAPSDPLIFFGRMTKLANMNDTSRNTEGANVKSLTKKGWFEDIGGGQQRRNGAWSTSQFIILEHEGKHGRRGFIEKREQVRRRLAKRITRPDAIFFKASQCPPWKYSDEDGELLVKGKLPENLARRNTARQVGIEELPDVLLNAIIERPHGRVVVDVKPCDPPKPCTETRAR
jgi:hypothetical protein